MKKIANAPSVWFVTGSQHLYGPEPLKQVESNSREVAAALDAGAPVPVIFRSLVTTREEILAVCHAANNDPNCLGLVFWMHTFSPGKMWITGLTALAKPFCHLHTQYGRDIPWATIDMDFMNLHQAAHGDREFGYTCTRLGKRRAVVAGHWSDLAVQAEVAAWTRTALGWHECRNLKVVRFSDNMRNVAVTEGDKVEAERVLGFSVNTHGIGDLVEMMFSISDSDVSALCTTYADEYVVASDLLSSGTRHVLLQDAARIELGLRKFLKAGGFGAFCDSFEDLHGLNQLPGLPVQRLMAEGYGFAAEGDWKHAALVRICKMMARGDDKGTSFMEDYTYHLDPNETLCLGAHMLEVCPSIAASRPTCEIHPLGIGGKADPVRLVFDGKPGRAVNASLVDMNDHFRLITSEVEAVTPPNALPKLPVARVLWRVLPDWKTGVTRWIKAGGAHHTMFSYSVTAAQLADFAEMAGIEYVAT